MTTLTLRSEPEAPLEAGAIVPDRFDGLGRNAIARLEVSCGNAAARLGDFFDVRPDGRAGITLEGDLGRVKNIAAGMTRGKVTIRGDAGMHLGAGMRGGEIDVHGSAGDWAGAEMAGGTIHIRGNAGHALGGAYRGSRHGMNRGLILVEGDAGNETGAFMRRGLIAVAGGAGDFTGAFAVAGTILVFGSLGARTGAGLLRGTVVAMRPLELLPTFRYACRYRPAFLGLVLAEIQAHGMAVAQEYARGAYLRYNGDLNRLGKGEILVYDQR